ncbi:MAG: hypothetical protein AB7P17_03360 [Nitrospirales bacterium]|nr:hypothetical protein [Nitrospirales bacterium]
MKYVHILLITVYLTIFVGMGFGQEVRMGTPNNVIGPSEMEVEVVDQNCWVELYEDTEFDVDDPHIRIKGPFEAGSLEALAGQDWSDEIESLIVGPSATIFVYKDPSFSGTEAVFVANQKVGELAELNMSDDIESIKVQCSAM